MPSNESPPNSNDETRQMELVLDESLSPLPSPLTETTVSLLPQTKVPGKLSRPTTYARVPSKSEREALSDFEAAVGGREELRSILGLSGEQPEQHQFLRLLTDEKRSHDSLALLCVDAGIRPSALLRWFKQGLLARAHVIATKQIADRLPAIATDVAEKSVDRSLPCSNCVEGKTEKGTCRHCGGKGRVVIESDIERQKLALELGGMIGGAKGPMVQIQQQIGISTDGSLFNKFVKQTDDLAFAAERDIIDAEVVPDE